jgi:hypothetical protein
MSLNSPKLQEDVALKSACNKLIFQVFQVFVAKLDRDVAIATHICCKRLFQMFHLFQTYVAVFI